MKTKPYSALPGGARAWLWPLAASLVLAAALALPGLACPRQSCPGCGGQARLCERQDCPYVLCPDCGSWQVRDRQLQHSPRRTGCHGRGGHHHGGRC